MQDRVVYHFSAAKLLLLACGSVAMTALSAAVGFGIIPSGADPLRLAICKAGTLFFGLCAVVAVARLLRARAAAVTLTASGLTDVRLAAEEIPWADITAIGTYDVYTSRFIVLDVDPAAEAVLSLSRTVRATRTANRRLGIRGLAMSTVELDVGTEALLAECRARWERAGRRG